MFPIISACSVHLSILQYISCSTSMQQSLSTAHLSNTDVLVNCPLIKHRLLDQLPTYQTQISWSTTHLSNIFLGQPPTHQTDFLVNHPPTKQISWSSTHLLNTDFLANHAPIKQILWSFTIKALFYYIIIFLSISKPIQNIYLLPQYNLR